MPELKAVSRCGRYGRIGKVNYSCEMCRVAFWLFKKLKNSNSLDSNFSKMFLRLQWKATVIDSSLKNTSIPPVYIIAIHTFQPFINMADKHELRFALVGTIFSPLNVDIK